MSCVAQPAGSDWAADVTGVLWYLVTYLWLVLLSPALLGLMLLCGFFRGEELHAGQC